MVVLPGPGSGTAMAPTEAAPGAQRTWAREAQSPLARPGLAVGLPRVVPAAGSAPAASVAASDRGPGPRSGRGVVAARVTVARRQHGTARSPQRRNRPLGVQTQPASVVWAPELQQLGRTWGQLHRAAQPSVGVRRTAAP